LGANELLDSGEDLLKDILMRKRHEFWFPLDGVGSALSFGGSDVGAVTAEVMFCWPKLPRVYGMWCPCCADVGFPVYDDVCAGWSDGRGIVGILANHLGVCRQFRIKAGSAEQVQRDDSLGEQEVL
jgi:hypothetical protein